MNGSRTYAIIIYKMLQREIPKQHWVRYNAYAIHTIPKCLNKKTLYISLFQQILI